MRPDSLLAEKLSLRQAVSMTLTLNLPDELAAFLPKKDADMVAVISAGLRRWRAAQRGEIHQLSDVAEALAGLPTPEEVLALRPSPAMAQRTEDLMAKSREQDLSADEKAEWDEIMRVEHLVRVAKAKAAIKLKAA